MTPSDLRQSKDYILRLLLDRPTDMEAQRLIRQWIEAADAVLAGMEEPVKSPYDKARREAAKALRDLLDR